MESNMIKNIFKGVGISFISTIILLLIYSCVLTFTNISENTMTTVISLITAISILIGSSIGNYKIKKNGLLNGGLVGGIYLLIIYLISSILNWQFGLNFESLILIAVGIIFGIIGGIIGVNKK
jgi:putative membrane protein (TIGR04086 family)